MASMTDLSTGLFNLLEAGVGSLLAKYSDGSPILQQGTLDQETASSLPSITWNVSIADLPYGLIDMFWTVNCFAATSYESLQLAQAVVGVLRNAKHVNETTYNDTNFLTEDDIEWFTEDNQNWIARIGVTTMGFGFNTEASILTQVPEAGAVNTPVSVRAIAI